MCDEHGDSAGSRLGPEQRARRTDLASPRGVVLGGDGVQKRRADGRTAERERCRLAGAAEPAREDGSNPKFQSPNALPDELRFAAALCREVALCTAVVQIDRIVVGLRLVCRRVADDEDHAAALQLLAERGIRGRAGRDRQSGDQQDECKRTRHLHIMPSDDGVRRSRLANQNAPERVDRKHPHRLSRAPRAAAHVRCEHDLVQREQLVADLWLELEDIQRGAGDDALVQGIDQRALVHDWSAGGVDQDCRALHRRQRPLVDQVASVGGEWTVEADDVGVGEQLFKWIVTASEGCVRA